MISREADYGLRVILFLSKQSVEQENVPTTLLSEKMNIPYPFLRQIVQRLIDGELIVSKKGKGGGVKLAKSPGEISLYDVIVLLNASGICLNECIEDKEKCFRSKQCTINKAFRKIQDFLDEDLKEITFNQL